MALWRAREKALALDPVDASHDRTGKHLHDRAASFGGTFRLHRDVTTGAANRVVNAEASSHTLPPIRSNAASVNASFLIAEPTAMIEIVKFVASYIAFLPFYESEYLRSTIGLVYFEKGLEAALKARKT